MAFTSFNFNTMSLDQFLSPFVAYAGRWAMVRRDGHPLLLLPASRAAARRTLDLFQPQRAKARAVIAGIRAAASLGLHGLLFHPIRYHGGQVMLDPPLPQIHPGTCGFLFGSPAHQIQRAIACYETPEGWEVAKVAFGEAGARMLEREANALRAISSMTSTAPRLLGLHRGDDATVLRMPYLTGGKIGPSESWDVIGMLESWLSTQPSMPIEAFPEWPEITAALAELPDGDKALDRLSGKDLVPALRHGDFTRWNLLKQDDGRIIVIDWEWGHTAGMPGIDLVHYHAQDARLVKRLAPHQVLDEVRAMLMQDDSKHYLKQSGWGDDLDALILAAIAYPVGAKHQENTAVLQEAVVTHALARA